MPPEALTSLRGRLLAFLLLPLLLLLLASVVADYQSAQRLASDTYDRELMRVAVALASRLERDDDDTRIEVDLPPAADEILRGDPDDPLRYLVLDGDGLRVAGDIELAPLAPPMPATPIWRDATLGDQALRVALHPYASPRLTALVVVAQATTRRDATTRRILQTVIWPNLLLIAATLLLVRLAVRRALVPLDTLSEQISSRAADDFRPLASSAVPHETRPLVSAINILMQRQQAAAEAQQAFLSDAAHQLRTPLSALQTQLELAAGEAPPPMRPRIARLLATTRRLTHSTHQMLSLARSADAAATGQRESFDLADLFEDCASDFLDLALERNIDLGFEAAPAPLCGTRWLLRELLANLVDNAIRYSAADGRVTVRCGTTPGGTPFLEVEDDGPGITPQDRQRVFERFHRGSTPQGDGSGLGLAIVRQVADLHGASIHLTDGTGGRGTRVRLDFPAAGPTPSRQSTDPSAAAAPPSSGI